MRRGGCQTALSAAAGFGLAWATGDAGNLENLPVLAGIECLTIIADNDQPDRATAKRAGLEAAAGCARRWREAGREVGVWCSRAPGQDFNDRLREAAA